MLCMLRSPPREPVVLRAAGPCVHWHDHAASFLLEEVLGSFNAHAPWHSSCLTPAQSSQPLPACLHGLALSASISTPQPLQVLLSNGDVGMQLVCVGVLLEVLLLFWADSKLAEQVRASGSV